MKTYRVVLSLLLGLAMVQAPASASAEKMDVGTHSLVIEKLERVLGQIKKSDGSRLAVQNRLADLYAERARQKMLLEVEAGKPATESTADRKQALFHYYQVLGITSGERAGKILLQIAHLHQLNRQPKEAEAAYKKLLSIGGVPNSIAAAGYKGYGDLKFQSGQPAAALQNYEKALTFKDGVNRGQILYKIAWCHLNLGREGVATSTLIKILRTPELMTRTTTSGEEFDPSFQEDVSRDLAGFMARGQITRAEIELMLELAPKEIKRENLMTLADETDRLGNKKGSLLVWEKFVSLETKPMDKLEAQVRVAQLQYDLGRQAKAVEDMAQAIAIWKTNGCTDVEECDGLKARLKRLVVNWNKAFKKTPSDLLLRAYLTYLSHFSDDMEMHFYAAQVARDLKNYRQAIASYHAASLVGAERLKSKAKDQKQTEIMFDNALLSEIELAELIKDPVAKLAAYDHYLAMKPTGPKALEVRYQKARVYYERNQYAEAAKLFDEVALSDDKKSAALRMKAADLALDSLVALKQDAQIEKFATVYAREFPQNRVEYVKIARKASVNLVAVTINSKESSGSELDAALEKLKTVNLAGASYGEVSAYYRNRIALAEKTQNLKEADSAANGLLNARGLTAEDRDFALSKKLWIAELNLEFLTAYQIFSKMKSPKMSEGDRLLKLAMLAELAGRNPKPHYAAYLNTKHSRDKGEYVRAKMVRSAKNMWRELKAHEPYLARNAELYSTLALEAFAKNKNYGEAQRVLKSKSVRRTAAGQALYRFVLVKEFAKVDRRIALHRMRSGSTSALQSTLKTRLAMLRESEEFAQNAIRSGDFTAQIVTLGSIERENRRLGREIMNLPAPRGLKGDQKMQYQKLLAQQAAPYLTRADHTEAKLQEFWADPNALESLAAAYRSAKPHVRGLIADEVRILASVAPSTEKSRVTQILGGGHDLPSARDIATARASVRRDPFNVSSVENLKKLEQESGSDVMVTYLDARLTQLQGGQK